MKRRNDEFGKLLRKMREERKLTQDGLRGKLNDQGYDIRNKGTISKWENGDSRPSEDTVEALEDALGGKRGTLLIPAGYLVEAPATVSSDATQRSAIATKRLEEHFDRLANMVNILLANGLETITKNDPSVSKFPYTLWSGQSGIAIPHELLSSYLQQNMDQLFLEYIDSDLQNFMSHLEAEHTDIGSKGLRKVVSDNPYELIDILRILAQKRIFGGKCDICKGLY